MSGRARFDQAAGVFRIYAKVQGRDGNWYVSCEEVHAFLAEYLAGELAAARRAEFERHLARCRSCAAYLESYRTTIELARESALGFEIDPAAIPRDLVTAILAARG